jgi:hypothetical protein
MTSILHKLLHTKTKDFGQLAGRPQHGSFNYDDPTSGVSVNASKISSLTLNGDHAHFTGPVSSHCIFMA